MSETNTETITFWRQPGGKTFKRTDGKDASRHVTPIQMWVEIADLRVKGWLVGIDDHKIKCVGQVKAAPPLTVDP